MFKTNFPQGQFPNEKLVSFHHISTSFLLVALSETLGIGALSLGPVARFNSAKVSARLSWDSMGF